MTVVCCAPVPAPEAHEIPDGARTVSIDVMVDWGADDAREEYAKTQTFCSFRCLGLWADEQASRHDGRTVPKET